MDYLFKRITVKTKKFGKIRPWICSKSKYGNGYFITLKKGNKILSGLVTDDGKEIIQVDRMELSGMVIANNNKDICFEFMHYDSDIPESYHVRILEDNTSKLMLNTNYKDNVPIFMCKLEDTNDFWALQAGIDNNKKYAVYDYKNSRIMTTFFEEIRYQDDSENHAFYYCMPIFSEDNTQSQILTYICGFLDDKGNLSSQIYDVKANELYNSYIFGPNTRSPKFCKLIDDLKLKYNETYQENMEHARQVIQYMYSYPNLSEKPKEYKDGVKILEYKPRKKV